MYMPQDNDMTKIVHPWQHMLYIKHVLPYVVQTTITRCTIFFSDTQKKNYSQ